MARGRWSTIKSVKRYAKGGAIQKTLGRVPEPVRTYCQEAMINMSAMLAGRLAAPRPTFGGLQVANLVRQPVTRFSFMASSVATEEVSTITVPVALTVLLY